MQRVSTTVSSHRASRERTSQKNIALLNKQTPPAPTSSTQASSTPTRKIRTNFRAELESASGTIGWGASVS